MVRNCTHSESLVLIRISFCISGTKNVAKQMRKIACGTQKTEGKSSFPELSDKCKLFYCVFEVCGYLVHNNYGHTNQAKLQRSTCTTV